MLAGLAAGHSTLLLPIGEVRASNPVDCMRRLESGWSCTSKFGPLTIVMFSAALKMSVTDPLSSLLASL
jgi:hypothetical protein